MLIVLDNGRWFTKVDFKNLVATDGWQTDLGLSKCIANKDVRKDFFNRLGKTSYHIPLDFFTTERF